MPESRGSNPNGANPNQVAAWRARAFRGLRPPRSAGADRRIPDEPLDEPEATRAASPTE